MQARSGFQGKAMEPGYRLTLGYLVDRSTHGKAMEPGPVWLPGQDPEPVTG